jgi:hypothetical protein
VDGIEPAATESRTRYWVAAGSVAAVIVVVAVVAFAMRGGSTPPAPPQAASTVTAAPAGSTADAPAETAPTDTAETSPPAAEPPTAASSVAPVATNGADAAATPPKPAAAARTRANAPPAPPTPSPADPARASADIPSAPANPPEPAPSAASLLPAFQFSAQTVVVEDGKNRQRDTNVELANGVVTVLGKDNKLVTTVPYSSVVGFTYSNSKQPMWNTEQGPAEIVHLDTGAFSLFRGDQHWLALRTDHMSLVLRVRDQESRRIIAALEERLGRNVERVSERKNR